MHLTKREQHLLYISVCAAVHGAISNKGRAKAMEAAQKAHERAAAALLQTRLAAKRK